MNICRTLYTSFSPLEFIFLLHCAICHTVRRKRAVLFSSVDTRRPFRRLPSDSRPARITRRRTGADRRRGRRGKRKTAAARVKIHDRQTRVGAVLDCISGTGTRRTYINERPGRDYRPDRHGFPEVAVTLLGPSHSPPFGAMSMANLLLA